MEGDSVGLGKVDGILGFELGLALGHVDGSKDGTPDGCAGFLVGMILGKDEVNNVGRLDGAREESNVGVTEGSFEDEGVDEGRAVGALLRLSPVGSSDGDVDGNDIGDAEGLWLRWREGAKLGNALSFALGKSDGVNDGTWEGSRGNIVGTSLGAIEPELVGSWDREGNWDGTTEGTVEVPRVGTAVGSELESRDGVVDSAHDGWLLG